MESQEYLQNKIIKHQDAETLETRITLKFTWQEIKCLGMHNIIVKIVELNA